MAINDTDTMILTGGSYSGIPMGDVSVYTEAGWKEELPKLNKARYRHGCSTYMSDGNRVKSNIIFLPHFILFDLLCHQGEMKLCSLLRSKFSYLASTI